MAISRKPRHWIPIPLAVAWVVLAVIRFADFSGEPAPRWQEIALMVLAPVCLGLITLNLVLDWRRSPEA